MNNKATTTDEYLQNLPDWQRTNLDDFRTVIHEVYPDITEEIKWGVPTFINKGVMMFAMSAFKAHTKYNFIYNGALISDPDGLFNNGLESKNARAIDLREGDSVDKDKLVDLVRRTKDL
jgi:hypothetical protein